MAGAEKEFLDLTEQTAWADDDVVAVQKSAVSGGGYLRIIKSNFLKFISLFSYTESMHNAGTISAGVYTPDCNANGNNHFITVGGDITIAVPVKTLTANNFVSGIIEVSNGALATDLFASALWDFAAGKPTMTAGRDLIAFKRNFGDAKTQAWEITGFGL